MSEAKFTKGDWEIKPIENDKAYIRIRGTSIGHRFKICNVSDTKNHHDGSNWCIREREEAMANAHLIKTAPKMYKLLMHLVSHDCINDASLDKEVHTLLAEARGEIN
jgi:hypothetical protein